MASEDDIIRVGIEGDPSDYIKALESAVSQNKVLLDRLHAQYLETSSRVESAVKMLNTAVSSINKQYGEGASNLPLFSQVTEEYTRGIVDQSGALSSLENRIHSVTSAIREQTESLKEAKAVGIRSDVPPGEAPVGEPVVRETPTEPIVPAPRNTLQIGEITAAEHQTEAANLLVRQYQTLTQIIDEMNAATITAATLQNLLQRAMTESGLASRALSAAQKEIGPTAAQGSAIAVSAIQMFERANIQAREAVDTLKGRIDSLAQSEGLNVEVTAQAAVIQERLSSAQALSARTATTLADIQKEASSSSITSVEQLESVYKRATAEMSLVSSALVSTQKEIGLAAAQGVEGAIQAINVLKSSYASASVVVSEVKSQLKVISSTTEDTEIAAIERRTVAEQQAASQMERLSAIQAEANVQTITSAELQNLLQRSMVESRTAATALGSAQREVGTAAAQGNVDAIATINILSESNTRAKITVDSLKTSLEQLRTSQASVSSSTETATAATDQLVNAQNLVARQTETLSALQKELAATSEITASQMAAVYRRAGTELNLTAAALRAAQQEIGPAAAIGSVEAAQALSLLQQQYAAVYETVKGYSAALKELESQERANAVVTDMDAIAKTQLGEALAFAARQTASLDGIQAELSSNIGASATQLGSVYVRAAVEARSATTALGAAQRALGPAVAAGNQEAIQALRVLSGAQQEATAYATLLRSQLGLLAETEGVAAAAATAEADAIDLSTQAKRAGAAATLAAAGAEEKLEFSTLQAFGASRVLSSEAGLGGAGFVLSRLISQSQILGPLFEALLPLSLVMLGVDMLKGWVDKIQEINDNYINLKSTMDSVEEVERRMAKGSEQDFQGVVDNQVAHLRYLGQNVEAAQLKQQSLKSRPIDMSQYLSDKTIDNQLKQLPEELREKFKNVFVDMAPDDIFERLGRLKKELGELEKKKVELQKQQDTDTTVANPEVGFIGAKMDDRFINQVNVAASLYGAAIERLQDMKRKFDSDWDKEGDEVSNERGRKLIKQTEEEINTMKLSGTYTKESERQKWSEVLKQLEEGTTNYHTVLQKMSSTVSTRSAGGGVDHTAQDLRKQDQDELTEMKLHGEEIGAERIRVLQGEEAFVRDRIAAESKYVDNVRFLRRELVTILQEEERERIKQEGAKARTMVTPEGKPNYASQQDFWNQVATDAKHGSEEYENAVTNAQRAGGEAIRTGNEELKKDIFASYDAWVASSHRTQAEILQFWESIKQMYAGSAPIVEEALRKISDATIKLREETERYNRLKAEGQGAAKIGELEQTKEEVHRDFTLKPRIQVPFGKSSAQQEKEIDQNIELEEIKQRQITAAREVDEAKTAYGDDSSEYQRALNRKEQMDRIYAQRSYQIQTQRMQAQIQEYQRMFGIIESGFNRAIDRLIDGDKKWYQSFGDIIRSIEKEFARMMINIAMQWLENKIIQLVLGQQPQQKSNNNGQQQQVQQTKQSNFQSAESYAGLSAAEEFTYALAQSAGNIPYAMGQAAIAYGTAQIWAAATQFKEGGLVTGDSNMSVPAVLHGKEMVLPHHLSTGIQNIINNGGGTSNGPSTVNNLNMRYLDHSRDGSNSPAMNTRTMMTEVRRGMRSFNGRG